MKTAWSNTKQTSSTSPGTIAPTIRSANPAGTSTVQKAKYRRVPSGSAFHHRHMRLMLRGGASICATGVSRSLDPRTLALCRAWRRDESAQFVGSKRPGVLSRYEQVCDDFTVWVELSVEVNLV